MEYESANTGTPGNGVSEVMRRTVKQLLTIYSIRKERAKIHGTLCKNGRLTQAIVLDAGKSGWSSNIKFDEMRSILNSEALYDTTEKLF